MAEPQPPGEPSQGNVDVHTSRLHLVWDVIMFQFKLAFDGVRDILLIPMSIITGVMGLVAGGDDPHQYFRRLLRFGQRSEEFINLFGGHDEGTSDKLVTPIRERVFSEATSNPWLRRAGDHLNQRLDDVNAARRSRERDPDR